MALQYRRQLNIPPNAALDPFLLAKSLKIRLCAPNHLKRLPPDVCARLIGEHADCWSAFTVNPAGRPLVVYNPRQLAGRKASNLMHEIAHLILKHKPSNMYMNTETHMALRSHDKRQEDEAAWLAGCLLLPKPALIFVKSENLGESVAARQYGVSVEMLRYRMGVSGVNIIFRRASGKRF